MSIVAGALWQKEAAPARGVELSCRSGRDGVNGSAPESVAEATRRKPKTSPISRRRPEKKGLPLIFEESRSPSLHPFGGPIDQVRHDKSGEHVDEGVPVLRIKLFELLAGFPQQIFTRGRFL